MLLVPPHTAAYSTYFSFTDNPSSKARRSAKFAGDSHSVLAIPCRADALASQNTCFPSFQHEGYKRCLFAASAREREKYYDCGARDVDGRRPGAFRPRVRYASLS